MIRIFLTNLFTVVNYFMKKRFISNQNTIKYLAIYQSIYQLLMAAKTPKTLRERSLYSKLWDTIKGPNDAYPYLTSIQYNRSVYISTAT